MIISIFFFNQSKICKKKTICGKISNMEIIECVIIKRLTDKKDIIFVTPGCFEGGKGKLGENEMHFFMRAISYFFLLSIHCLGEKGKKMRRLGSLWARF